MGRERDPFTEQIIGAAIEVHKELGPGLLESAYEFCLCQELRLRSYEFVQQMPLPVSCKGVRVECGYRLDIVFPGELIIEIKAVDALLPIHEAQLLSYMKLSGIRKGLLINFHVRLLRDGIKRFLL